jgi:Ca2+-binding RTX toxin-like protein
VRGAPGETNVYSLNPAEQAGRLQIGDTAAPSVGTSLCTQGEYFLFVTCDVPAGGVRLEGGDRDDQLNVGDNLPGGLAVTLDGGTGNDVLRGNARTPTADRLLGGDGNDTITGGIGADAIEAGAGDDAIDGQEGPDVVHAGDGNDSLLADDWQEQSTDVIDGGPGYDQIENNWVSDVGVFQPPIVVSVDGQADDGRPNENDNVTDVERIYLNAAATLTGSEGADELTVFNNDAGSRLNGRGGDDKLNGFDLDDAIDGGAGNDAIQGGYGHDMITGGPGRDVINGDANGATCHWIQCRSPYGNDHIDARDGEADNITCGVGEDTVEADAADTVAADCDVVHRSAGGGAGGPGGHGGSAHRASLRALHARRSGRAIVVTGRAAGVERVGVRALRGRHTVAKTIAAVRSGRFRAKLRAPRRVRVVVAAGSLKRSVKVR